MTTRYVMDTSALVVSPKIYESYTDCTIILPIVVLNELDNLKKQLGMAGKNARAAIREIEKLSELGDISVGVLTERDVLVKVDATYYPPDEKFANFGDPTYGDTQILICLQHHFLTKRPEDDVILVSNDINLRIKAKGRGIDAEAPLASSSLVSELYAGTTSIDDEEAGDELRLSGIIDAHTLPISLYENEFVDFFDSAKEICATGKKVKDNIKLMKRSAPWGVAAKNHEQAKLIDLIMDRNIDLVSVCGMAGSGKTLVSLAAATEMVLNKKEYSKLIIYKPIVDVDDGIGYLPGDVDEKLHHYFSNIRDNYEVIFGQKYKASLDMYMKKGIIEFGVISYIRGRSIKDAIMLVDEAQNMSTSEIKTMLTRAGEGTKIILTGDLEQIDTKNLDTMNNGLTYVIEKFKNSKLSGHITLVKGERSRLATEAANLL